MEPVQSSLVDQILNFVVVVFGPVLSALLTALLVQLFRKAGVELDQTKQNQIQSLLFKLVAQTEEWASVKIKNGVALTAEDKANHYLALVAQKLPNVTAEEATEVAKQILGHARLAATGVLRDVAVAVEKK